VLDGALDRSLQLAASMDARGFGRHGARPRTEQRLAGGLIVGGLLALCVGSFGLLGNGLAPSAAWASMGIGVVLAVAAMRVGGRRVQRSRYRPDVWRRAEHLVAASGALALVGVVWTGARDGAALAMPTFPLDVPAAPVWAIATIVAAAAPAMVAPSVEVVVARRRAASAVDVPVVQEAAA
jgi:energy-coupling factor transport system permease protein